MKHKVNRMWTTSSARASYRKADAFLMVSILFAALLSACSTSERTDAAPEAMGIEPVRQRPLVPIVDEDGVILNADELIEHNVIFGVPKTTEPVTVLENLGYTAGYCEEKRVPLWVSYRVFGEGDFEPGPRPSRFLVDDRIDNPVRHDDYTNTGYDRGHMAPNAPIARRYGSDAQRDTFLTTNIVPQLPGLNQRGWAALESVISDDWASRFTEVWVFVGPIFDDEECWELEAGTRIPSQCYMIIVDIDDDDGMVHSLAIIMEQRRINAEPLKDFVSSIATIEAMTGLDFLHELENAVALIESTEPDARWEIEQILTPSFPGSARQIRRRRCD